jgi:hypothetical protein
VKAFTLAILATIGLQPLLTVRGQGVLSIAGGSVVTGAGTIEGLVQPSARAVIAPGNGVGTLTATSLALSTGTIMDYELTTMTSDLISVTGTNQLTILGGGIHLFQPGTTTTFNSPGTYYLIGYAGTVQGAITNLVVLNPTTGRQYSLVNNTASHFVDLVIGNGSLPNHWLRNISTRGFVQSGNNVMIGGFIVARSSPKNVIVRARTDLGQASIQCSERAERSRA